MFSMKGYITPIERETVENSNYRKVLYTAQSMQLVLMSIEPGDEIGEETHHLDQFIRLEEGTARIVLDGVEYTVQKDWAVIIPAGVTHNVSNCGVGPLKLYSIYGPPEHKDGTIHVTKADAHEEHFDGVTTE
jgi:mannose-6-phosphate isomerase-like protein (cupin superfamily)